MKKKDFDRLKQSVREMKEIMRGSRAPSRVFEVREPDVTGIRDRLELSQSEFAAVLGISVRTLQEWEQGRRKPTGPARVLLEVADQNPQAIVDVVYRRTAS